MGGVVLLDSNIARHKIFTKSKEWLFPIFLPLTRYDVGKCLDFISKNS